MFKKGQSGNPGGRPKTPEIFKKHVGTATAALLKLTHSSDENIQFKALQLVLAYGLGKPKESVEHSGTLSLENLLGDSAT